ncbi:hypothetical protein N431DRAFT_186158 [Stipitochalara longipes BDJ]|nr:hypothetical protein N431DRAFT_186158 [Stipitochalara longipes BDJ]
MGELRGSRLLISVPWLQRNWRRLLLSGLLGTPGDAFTMLRVSGLQRMPLPWRPHANHRLSDPSITCPRPMPRSRFVLAQISNAILEKVSPWQRPAGPVSLHYCARHKYLAVSLRGPGHDAGEEKMPPTRCNFLRASAGRRSTCCLNRCFLSSLRTINTSQRTR